LLDIHASSPFEGRSIPAGKRRAGELELSGAPLSSSAFTKDLGTLCPGASPSRSEGARCGKGFRARAGRFGVNLLFTIKILRRNKTGI
jgi:hypothetical protein